MTSYRPGRRLCHQDQARKPSSASPASIATIVSAVPRCFFTRLTLDERELAMGLEAGGADADEAQRAGPVVEGAVEKLAGELGDSVRIVRADREARRAAADRAVPGAHPGRHPARGLALLLQVLGGAA